MSKKTISKDVLNIIELLFPEFQHIQNCAESGFVLFGAGQFGEAALNYLVKKGYVVNCFVDNSKDKQGKYLKGIPIVSKEHPLVKSAQSILITAKHAVIKIKEQLGCDKAAISFDAWFVMSNLDKYERIKNEILFDERSKYCLDGIMLAMLTGNENYCAEVMDYNQYFCIPQFVNNSDDVFIDAGAYVGDTIEKFIWANNGGFKHIYAFEPGKRQFEALLKRKERLINEWALEPESVSLINGGLSEEEGRATINLSDAKHLLSTSLNIQSEKNNSVSDVKIYKIDSFFKEISVTFIKSDIEGMEVAMLKGAVNTIKKHRPKMALSTYHEPDDLFEIIDLVYSINAEYKMMLRHHSPMLMDTTLYCWHE